MLDLRTTIMSRASLLAAALLASSALASPAQAAGSADLEKRVEKLEGLLQQILTRLESQDSKLAEQDQKIVEESAKAVTQAKAASQMAQAADEKVAAAAKANEKGFRVGKTTFSISGFAKGEVSLSRFSDGVIATNDVSRDFLIPGAIPVAAVAVGKGWQTDYNARQTRIILKTSTDVGGHTLGSHLEMDFMATVTNADERITNGFSPELRQAFVTYDNWLFGQSWSTFQDVTALPEALDFIGPTSGTVFVRQPQIRYTNGPWQVSLEQPEVTVTSRTGARLVDGDDKLPDAVVRYNAKLPNGTVSIAAIARRLQAQAGLAPQVTSDQSAIGFGVSLAGKIKLGARDDVRFMATAGSGLGRYIALNAINDAAIKANGDLDPITTYSGFVALRHMWTDKARSTVSFAALKADHSVPLTGGGVTDMLWDGFVNYVYSPVPPLDLGVEFHYARRELENGLSGTLSRLQFAAKYSF
jgi:DcaP outer membrane protein